ncbi:hypothetical protein [Alteromonas sp. RKMC-009]|uniref:hypothetical protein n=1 Tax=Alteromonas sp. RKMC-009 TaxID=2267264 RepID=UPI000F0CBD2E|nr:hypothetical protein [Alteromonas sp. RKMC-009]AYN07673.1 hypothetical protein DS731_22015 [Alteromonas sp. RKMC-009]
MSVIESAVVGSKRLEQILKTRFGAEGRGLHEYVTSVESELPTDVVKQIRYIASVRNRVVHDNGEINDLDAFNRLIDELEQRLNAIYEYAQEAARIEEEKHLAALQRVRDVREGAPPEALSSAAQPDPQKTAIKWIAIICFTLVIILVVKLDHDWKKIRLVAQLQ